MITRQRLALKPDTLGSLNVWEISRYLAGLTVQQVMVKPKDLVTITPDRTVERAAAMMTGHKIGCLPVVEEGNIVVGIVTEKDCLRVLSHLAYDEAPGVTCVADYQSKVRVVLEPAMDIFRVAEAFLETNFPVLPVVDGDRIAGLIARQDVLRGILALHGEIERSRAKSEHAAGRQAERPRAIEDMQRRAANATPDQLVRLFGRPSRPS